jgi:hypothetical protein
MHLVTKQIMSFHPVSNVSPLVNTVSQGVIPDSYHGHPGSSDPACRGVREIMTGVLFFSSPIRAITDHYSYMPASHPIFLSISNDAR